MKVIEAKILSYLKKHPNEWLTTNDICKGIDGDSASSIGEYMRRFDGVERIISSSHKRYYRYVGDTNV